MVVYISWLLCLRIGTQRSCLVRTGTSSHIYRGRQREVWSRIINDLFVSLGLDIAEWLKDIMDGSSSLKAFLALAGESISERESKRFEEAILKGGATYIHTNIRGVKLTSVRLPP